MIMLMMIMMLTAPPLRFTVGLVVDVVDAVRGKTAAAAAAAAQKVIAEIERCDILRLAVLLLLLVVLPLPPHHHKGTYIHRPRPPRRGGRLGAPPITHQRGDCLVMIIALHHRC